MPRGIPNAKPTTAAPTQAPDGFITREGYKARYGEDAYQQVPEESWSKSEYPDTMSPREWARVRGKRGL